MCKEFGLSVHEPIIHVVFLNMVSVPEAPPTNVKVKSINSTAIHVFWKPPNPQKINGINQGYKLQVSGSKKIHYYRSKMFTTANF